MKNLALVFLLILGTLTSISAQVTSVKYLIEYNDATSVYDVKLSIEEGAATTVPQRIQFNAQITVIVPTGATIGASEYFNPIQNNSTYSGTVPMVWTMGTGVIAPVEQPESDFYNFYPDLSIISHYNNLIAGDLLTLFSIDINIDPCENTVRLFENGVDPEDISGASYINGFTLGSIEQIYDGNLESTYAGDWTATLPDYEVCEGQCIELVPNILCAPEDLTYAWNTGETTPTITVCPSENTTYSADITDSNMNLLSISGTVEVIDLPIVSVNGSSEICAFGTTFVTPSTGGVWTSDNPAIATVTNGGVVTGISGGTTMLYFTGSSSGCTSEGIEINVNPLPIATITGSDSICVNGISTLTPTTGGTWTSSNNIVATIDNSGNVTAHAIGTVVFVYTNLTTGCSSEISETLWVIDDPTVAFTGDDRLCIGEASSVSPNTGGTWVSNNTGVATIVAATGIITAVAQGTTTFTYTDATSGCTATTSGLIIDPVPSVSTDSDMICITSTANLSPSTGGSWTALNSSIASLVGNVVTGVASGDAGFLFTSDATGCVSDTLFINIDSGATTMLTGPNQICAGETTTIEPNVDGSWSSSDPLIATIDNFGNITAIGPGVATFVYISAATLCASDPSEPVQVNPSPFVNAPSTSLCIMETMNLTPAFGGTWSSSDPSVLTINAFTGLATAVGAGSATCTFTSASTGCSATTEVVTVHETPFVEFTAPNVICAGFTTALSPSSGGTWTSNNINVASVGNAGNVTGIAQGIADLIFTETATGCVSEALTVTVLSAPIVSLNTDDEFCIGETTQLLPSSGGTWTSANPAIATVTSGGLAQATSAGQTTFTFTSSATGCSSAPTDPITVHGPVTTVITGPAVFCIGGSSQMSPSTGGSWTSSDPGVLTITNTGFVTGVAEGSATFTFTPTATGCPSFPSDPILVEKCEMTAFSCDDISPDNVYCDYGVFSQLQGSLSPDDSPGIQPEFLCDNEAGNIVWIGFTALEGDYEIEINTSNCVPQQAGGVPGVQIGIYSSCTFDESNFIFCEVGGQDNNQFIISSEFLTAGNVYYLYIDGLDNSTCEFDIDINGNYDNTYCTDLSKVTGVAYIDANENGEYDLDETPLRNVLISLFPGNFSVLTNDEGKYIINTPKGGATLTAQANEGDWVEELLTLEDVSVLEQCVEDINFGFVPTSNSNLSATLSVSNTIVRCDWETRFYITIENTGTETFNGLLEFEFDDKADFFSSPIPNLNQNGNILTAATGELLPFTPQEYQITLKMPSGSSNLPILDFKATLRDVNEVQVADYSYSEQLKCSYDPNDKREYPDRVGADNLTLMDEDIEYTIRFQNNGNDTAFQVKIVDELDPNIDPRSISVVNSSHDVETCIEGNLLIFLFENINLVDSMTNYVASQGFVTFRCSTKDGSPEFTPVHNTADIIFDTNIPIITNTTINTLVSVLCTNVTTELDVEICEGDIYEGHEESGTYTTAIPLEFGCDSIVIIHLDVQGITYSSQEIDICEGDSILLNGTLYTINEPQEIKDTIINSVGCITNVQNYNFQVITAITMDVDTTICEGMDYEGLVESGIYTINSLDPNTGCDIITTVDLEVLPIGDPLCTVGVDDLIENEIKVFPNPAGDVIYIEAKSEIESISVYSGDYSKISEEVFTIGKNKIQLSTDHLIQGLYFLGIKSNGRFIYKKLIVE